MPVADVDGGTDPQRSRNERAEQGQQEERQLHRRPTRSRPAITLRANNTRSASAVSSPGSGRTPQKGLGEGAHVRAGPSDGVSAAGQRTSAWTGS